MVGLAGNLLPCFMQFPCFAKSYRAYDNFFKAVRVVLRVGPDELVYAWWVP